ncbi:MAG: hypothetical protein IPI85_04140 [Dehalococcoidia bacterium]|nr:hypothetical protein [Dehalococcoidia bacterium]
MVSVSARKRRKSLLLSAAIETTQPPEWATTVTVSNPVNSASSFRRVRRPPSESIFQSPAFTSFAEAASATCLVVIASWSPRVKTMACIVAFTSQFASAGST